MRIFKLLWFEVWQGIPPKGRIFIAYLAKHDKFYTINVTKSFRATLAIVLIALYLLIVTNEPTTP